MAGVYSVDPPEAALGGVCEKIMRVYFRQAHSYENENYVFLWSDLVSEKPDMYGGGKRYYASDLITMYRDCRRYNRECLVRAGLSFGGPNDV